MNIERSKKKISYSVGTEEMFPVVNHEPDNINAVTTLQSMRIYYSSYNCLRSCGYIIFTLTNLVQYVPVLVHVLTRITMCFGYGETDYTVNNKI